MAEFWEETFKNNSTMWGERPTDNALAVLKIFQEHKVQSVLVPGFGYGRNAKVFYDQGMSVTGIEIAGTAIDKARKHWGRDLVIHHGPVSEMPFDETNYDAVYCYSLIHLLEAKQRAKLVSDCYGQLNPGGLMVFVALSTSDLRYGKGQEIARNTFLSPHGLVLYFYDEVEIRKQFAAYAIRELREINEPRDSPTERFWMVICEKQ